MSQVAHPNISLRDQVRSHWIVGRRRKEAEVAGERAPDPLALVDDVERSIRAVDDQGNVSRPVVRRVGRR